MLKTGIRGRYLNVCLEMKLLRPRSRSQNQDLLLIPVAGEFCPHTIGLLASWNHICLSAETVMRLSPIDIPLQEQEGCPVLTWDPCHVLSSSILPPMHDSVPAACGPVGMGADGGRRWKAGWRWDSTMRLLWVIITWAGLALCNSSCVSHPRYCQ